MNSEYLELMKQAEVCLNEMSIMDSDAFINNILLELIETDDSNLEIKKQTLEEIKKLLSIKNKIKIKNDDLYYLKTLSEKLKQENNISSIKLTDDELNKLLIIIKNNF